MGIYRLSNGVVRVFGVRGHVRAFKSGDMSAHSKYAPDAVACAVLNAELHAARNPLRTADTTATRLNLDPENGLGRLAPCRRRRGEG
jgi:hypothetical protein